MNAPMKKQVKVLTGNGTAANAALLCRPEVVAAYPITPQSEVVETISQFHANGELNCEFVNVEGENSAMNVVCGASMAGSRVFTATSSYGLVYMYDTLMQAAAYRAPIVMVNVNREPPGVHSVVCGQQDMISVRDSGWLQVICETDQEIMDTIIQGYKLAEDYSIQLPIMVNYDGYYLSFLAEAVEIPGQDEVDAFLAPLKDQPKRQTLIPGEGIGCGSHGMGDGFVEVRQKHLAAMEKSKAAFDQIDADFGKAFGRTYGGQVEGYRTDDADFVIVTSGSVAGSARVIIDQKREEGMKVGMVKIKMYRPFPKERILEEITGKKAVGVLDRSIAFGWDCGPMFMETKAISPDLNVGPMLSFIDGLANKDITFDHIEKVIDDTYNASQGKSYQEVTWL